ncbi:MAG: hypothetical protein IJ228_13515 [Succinivibrio sp.]|nr:hypothetical protein [Succinivibrio sp.]
MLHLVGAADLNEEGLVPQEQLSSLGQRRRRACLKSGSALKNSAKNAADACAQAHSALSCGALFIEYRNSHKKPALLKVAGSVYRGKTCRITLATPRVPEVLEALKDQEQLLLRVDPQTCYHLVIAPSDPQNSLPVAVRYVLGAI